MSKLRDESAISSAVNGYDGSIGIPRCVYRSLQYESTPAQSLRLIIEGNKKGISDPGWICNDATCVSRLIKVTNI